MTDAWDPSIPEHKAVAHGIEVGDGIAEMRTYAAARKALNTVGFEILHEEDLADRERVVCEHVLIASGNDAIKWFYPLEGHVSKAQTVWDSEWSPAPFGKRY